VSAARVPNMMLPVPSRRRVLEGAADEAALLEAVQAQLADVHRRPAVEGPLGKELTDDRAVLEAVAAVAAGHEQPFGTRHPVDDRMQVRAHVVEAGVAASEDRAAHRGEAHPEVVAV